MINKTSDQFLLDAYEGQGGFADGAYLISHGRESTEKFNKRKELAIYPNFCRKIIDVYVGYLWTKQPNRTDISDNYTQFVANADGNGTALDALLLTYQRLAVILGTVYIIVDKPPVAGTSKANDPLPYLAIRTRQQLVKEEKDSRGEWISVTFSETVNDKTIERTFTRTGWSISEDVDGTGILSGSYNLGRVPVVKLHAAPPLLNLTASETSTSRKSSTSFFQDLAALNWDLYNLRSELRELLRAQTFAVLTFPVQDVSWFDKLKNLVIGTENALLYAQGSSAPGFISPDGTNVTLYLTAIAETINDIYRIANLEFVGSVQPSGEALSFHFQEANSSLRTMAEQCETAEKKIKTLVDLWMGSKDSPGSVAYNNNFNLKDLARELAIALDSISLQISDTFDKEVKKRVAKSVLDDLNPETMSQIEDEINQGQDPYQARIAAAAGVNQ